MTLNDTLVAGLNNPDCAFYVGAMLGGALYVRIAFYILLLGVLYRLVDRLAWDPLVSWLKKKLYKNREEGGA